jgi:ribosome-binding factor A
VIGGKVKAKESMEGMESASGFIYRELKRRLRIKQVPKIRYLLDTSLEAGQRMLTLLDQVKEIEANQSDETLGN